VDKANAAGCASYAIGAGASLVLLGSLCELLWLEPRWKGHSFPLARFYGTLYYGQLNKGYQKIQRPTGHRERHANRRAVAPRRARRD
jgi:hypothetical protein